MEIDKQKVKELLTSLESLDTKEITRADGTLDVKEFNALPEVREVVSKLKELGVTRPWLREYFNLAGLILTFAD